MNILENYLIELDFEDSDLFSLLSKFEKVVTFKKDEDIAKGLLKYKSISPNMAFLFKMSEEEILTFHTVGMKFDIDIYFFNKSGRLVNWFNGVKPGVKKISSNVPAMYAVETLSER